MSITIKRYQKNLESEWDKFVLNSNNGTLFHYRNFLNYHQKRSFCDHSLLFYWKNKLCAILPAAEDITNGKKIYYSHPGASFGGMVYEKPSFEIFQQIILSFEEYLKENQFNEIFLVQTPVLYGEFFDESIDYLLRWNKYKTDEMYISSTIDLSGNPHDRLNSRKQRYLNKLDLSENFRLEWNDDYESFYPILVENKAKHGVTPTHSLNELLDLKKRFPDLLSLLMLYENNIPIGGTLNFTANNKVAIIFYNMIRHEFANKQPSLIQISETIRWAKESGFKWLDFGVSQKSDGTHLLAPHLSLIKFKEQFGATGMIRRAYRKEL